jgi:pyruvate formate lyase activating enzyme
MERMGMDIRGFLETSFVDWDGRVAAVVFTPGCTLRCGFCYNHPLILHPEKYDPIPEEVVLDYLRTHRDFLDGLCITGGEPTLQSALLAFCRKVKALGMEIKLDTNGTNPEMLRTLLEEGLLATVAMDIKAPLRKEAYERVCGPVSEELFGRIRESVDLLLQSPVETEFRTTIVPSLHSKGEVEEIAHALRGAEKYVLQKFRPDHSWDPDLRNLPPQEDEEMEALKRIAKRHLENVLWRGR